MSMNGFATQLIRREKPIRIDEFDAEKSWWYDEQPKKKGKSKVDAAFEPSHAALTETPQSRKVPIEQVVAAGYKLDI